MSEVEFDGVGGVVMRLAGVEINQRIKRKIIDDWGAVLIGIGEPVRKEMKI